MISVRVLLLTAEGYLVPRANVAKCWLKIEKWLADNVPDAVPMLPAGVSSDDLAAAEETLGYSLPREVKQFFSVHNGSGSLWLHDRGEFMSLETVLSSWDNEFDLWGDGNNDEWAAPQGPIKKKWFTRKWLPIIDAWTGDYVCVDSDPPKGGKREQLISWYHDRGPTDVIAPSFGDLLAEFVNELAAGLYTADVNRVGQPYLKYAKN